MKTPPPAKQVREILAALEALATKRDRENLARFGISAKSALGVSMANIQKLAKTLGQNHELAGALWDTGCYEARLLMAFVAEPGRVTPAQMERWCKEFDNWAVCDTLCFFLFDRVPHAWDKIRKWSGQSPEFVKRAAFALMASIAGHDKQAADAVFLEGLALIERAAKDDRNFVKKAVSWALRRIGRRNQALNRAAVALSARLASSPDASERWLGKGAHKELTSALVARALGPKKAAKKATKKVAPTPAVKNTPKKKTAGRGAR
ncbi:MAG TPA: DNA alkylation repair protein [Polyangiaceae bacterium]|nr:DNA alkylation repair protein [Polyangiaceae bacterium]